MVTVDVFTQYVALNPVPHGNAYYANATLYEHWIEKFGLPEILVTDNGTEFINNETNTFCHLHNSTAHYKKPSLYNNRKQSKIQKMFSR